MSAARNACFGMAVLCLAVLGFSVISSGTAQAASCGDPWVTQATTQVLGHAPASSAAVECNVNLYAGHNSAGQLQYGQWSSYNDLSAAVSTYWSQHDYRAATASAGGSCGDPWVTQAVTETYGRPPASANAPECNVNLYQGHNQAGQLQAGQWNSYADLKAAVVAFQAGQSAPAGGFAISSSAFTYSQAQALPTGTLLPNGPTVYLYNGNWYQLVSQGGGNMTQLVSQGGGNLLSTASGSLVSQGGGNIVSAGGGNILLNGGANLARYKGALGLR